MAYWIVYAEQTGSLAGMASYERIQTLFDSSRLTDVAGAPIGTWVSRVRVTRRGGLSSIGGGQTTAAAVYTLPDTADQEWTDRTLAALRARVDGMLAEDTRSGHASWDTPTVRRFLPAVNGSIDWWRCSTAANCASNTMTMQGSPAMTSGDYENPTGPTLVGVNAPHQFSMADFTKPLYIVLGLVAVVAVAPTLYTLTRTVAKPATLPAPAVANPRNKRHVRSIR